MKEGKCERSEQSSFNDCRYHWSFSFLNHGVLAKFVQLAYSDSGGDATSPCMLSQIVMSGPIWRELTVRPTGTTLAKWTTARVSLKCVFVDDVIDQNNLVLEPDTG